MDGATGMQVGGSAHGEVAAVGQDVIQAIPGIFDAAFGFAVDRDAAHRRWRPRGVALFLDQAAGYFPCRSPGCVAACAWRRLRLCRRSR